MSDMASTGSVGVLEGNASGQAQVLGSFTPLMHMRLVSPHSRYTLYGTKTSMASSDASPVI